MNNEHLSKPNRSPQDRYRDGWLRFVYIILWPVFNLFRPLHIYGRENIPQGAAVICPNHVTLRDPFYVLFAFTMRNPIRAMAKIEIMRLPIAGWVLKQAGVFGVERGTVDAKAVKNALTCLKEGNKLLMFPEGTRVRDGKEVTAKTGAAMFATRTGVPLMPIYVQPGKGWFASNSVVIGKPFYPEFEGRKPTADELSAITDDLMRRIYALKEVLP